MKLLGFALPASIPTIIFVGHALSACGGSSSAPLTSGGDGNGNGNGNNNGQDATTGGNNDDASSGNPGSQDASKPTDSSITIPDGGFVLPPVEAGALGSILPGAPGTIECGQIDCAVTSNTCCANTDGGTSCVAGTTTTCPQGTLHCAQAADCPSGQLCCATFKDTGGTVSAQTSCQTGPCGTDTQLIPGAQLCATGTTECPSGSPCTKQSCEGETLQLCGLFTYSGVVNVTCTAE
ncbi:MAG: hypothetical protein ACLQVI_26675 [Polyangiaceae bacterium]